MSARVSLTCDAEGIATLEMRDAEGKNALGEELVAELTGALDDLRRRRDAKVLVLAGLPWVFCSGAPRELLLRFADGRAAPTDILLSKLLLDLPIPAISAMEGHATGGGLALGLCADIIVMARESRYGCSFMNMGFTPGMGITRLLEHVLSPAVAHELMLTGEFRRGAEFEGRSGVNHVVPRALVREKATSLAQRIAEKPRTALVLLKGTLSLPRREAFESSYTLESLMHEVSFAVPEVRRAIEDEYGE